MKPARGKSFINNFSPSKNLPNDCLPHSSSTDKFLSYDGASDSTLENEKFLFYFYNLSLKTTVSRDSLSAFSSDSADISFLSRNSFPLSRQFKNRFLLVLQKGEKRCWLVICRRYFSLHITRLVNFPIMKLAQFEVDTVQCCFTDWGPAIDVPITIQKSLWTFIRQSIAVQSINSSFFPYRKALSW